MRILNPLKILFSVCFIYFIFFFFLNSEKNESSLILQSLMDD